MSDFATKLDVLTSAELSAGRCDPERLSDMIEKLSRSLGFTIAVAAGGDPRGIDTLAIGCSEYVHGEAVSKAPMARVLTSALGGQ